jgi:hypothetical protein
MKQNETWLLLYEAEHNVGGHYTCILKEVGGRGVVAQILKKASWQ